MRCPAGAADGYPASCAPAVDLGPKASMPSFVRARFQAGDCMPDDASACSTTDGPNDRAGGALIVPRREAFGAIAPCAFSAYYDLGRAIGCGASGTVYEASPRAAPEAGAGASGGGLRRVAAKCFVVQADADSSSANMRASFEHERSLLSGLEHPHIVKAFECFEEARSCWIVMELCSGGELCGRIEESVRTRGRGLDECIARDYFRQALRAVSYLHAQRIVHRDVKTENLLLTPAGDVEAFELLKLTDLGTAVQLTPDRLRAPGVAGTLSYIAPEVYSRRSAGLACDVWSLGVVLYVTLVGISPFRGAVGQPEEEIVRSIAAGRYDTGRAAWRRCSASARDLVASMLVVDERRRWLSSQVAWHHWLAPDASERAAVPDSLVDASGPRRDDLSALAVYAPAFLALAARFERLDALQKLLLVACARLTPDAELVGLVAELPWYDLFLALDAGGDGRIVVAELAAALCGWLGDAGAAASERVVALVSALDIDGSGAVEWAEWAALALMAHGGVARSEEPLRTVFRALDRPSGDGALGVEDVAAIASTDLAAPDGVARVARRLVRRWASADPHSDEASETSLASSGPAAANGDGCAMELSDARRALQDACTTDADGDVRDIGISLPTAARPAPLDLFGCCQSDNERTLALRPRQWLYVDSLAGPFSMHGPL